MTTEWTDTKGKTVAVVSWGGVSRGVRVQVKVSREEWEATETVVSESGEVCTRQEVEAKGTVVERTRWVVHSEAVAWEKAARRWSSHSGVAHACAAEAQRCHEEARSQT